MWRNIVALSGLVISCGITFYLIQSANADFGPRISQGANPIVNEGGTVPSSGLVATAPSDQDLIVTTLMTNGYCGIQVNGTTLVQHGNYFSPTYIYMRPGYAGVSSSFTMGNAKLKVPAGGTLTLTNCNGNTFYMEGYLMHP